MSGAAGHGGWQHWLGFLASGAATFITDNGVLEVLVRGLGVPVLPSRIVSIWCAMAVGFFAHRTLTFAVATRPNWGEFVRYIGVAWTASAVNFGIFAAILFVLPDANRQLALAVSAVAAMVVSYFGMRFGAFSRPHK